MGKIATSLKFPVYLLLPILVGEFLSVFQQSNRIENFLLEESGYELIEAKQDITDNSVSAFSTYYYPVTYNYWRFYEHFASSNMISEENDTQDPTASNPDAITIQCATEIPDPDPLVVTDEADNLTSDPEVTFVRDISDGGSNPEVITRTYSITDEAGNSIEVTQTITVEDTLAPTASNPAPVTVQCKADVPQPNIAVVINEDDNCSANPVVAFVKDVSNGGSNPEIVTRTYSITDEAGNSIEVTQTITVEDTLAPTASNPAPVTVQCKADVPQPNIAVVINEDDNCSANPVVAFVKDASNGGSNPEIITRTYSITDDADKSIEVTQTITIDDTIAPTAGNPAPVTVQCKADVPQSNIAVVINEDDNCSANPVVAFVKDVSNGGSNPEIITRTYSITDQAGNSIEVSQTITVDDTIAPTASNPAPVTVQCKADVPQPNIAVVINEDDNCSANPIVAFVKDVSNGGSNPELITRTYSITDEAGNSIEVTQTITVDDTLDPTGSNPAPVTVQCKADVPSPDIAVVINEDDNCSAIPTVAFIKDVSNGGSNPEIITRTYSITDEAGNSIGVTQTITVDDTLDPTASNPAPVTVQCKADVPSPNIAVVINEDDNCSAIPTVAFVKDVSNGGSNPEIITRTYSITDEAGNSIEVTQTITVDDTLDPTASNPAPVTVQCKADIPQPNIAVVINEDDNCSANPVVAFVKDVSNGGSNPEVITRTYSITDDAGNSIEVTQRITVEDTLEPTASNPAPILMECHSPVITPDPSVVLDENDNCTSSPVVTFVKDVSNGGSNPKIITRTYRVTDEAGNSIEVDQLITIPGELNAQISQTNVTCFGSNDGKITITSPTGGYGTFEYSINNGVSWMESPIFNDLKSGRYQVLMRDKAHPSCSITIHADLEITQPEKLSASFISTNVTCNGANNGSITITGTAGGHGAYEYSIDGGISWNQSGKFQNLPNKNDYTLIVRDRIAPHCQITLATEYSITQPKELALEKLQISGTSCYDAKDGSISAAISEITGTAPYSYSINNTDFRPTGDFSGLSSGSHTLFVIDANGCAFQTNFVISRPDQLKAEVTTKNVNCFGGNDGAVTIQNISGTQGDFRLRVGEIFGSPGQKTIGNLSVGTYEVYLSNANSPGCEILLKTVNITQPATALQTTVDTNYTLDYGTATGTATAVPTGGTPGYTYEWFKVENNGKTKLDQVTFKATNLYAGEYELIVTDANGCSTHPESFKIIDALSAEIASRNVCEGDKKSTDDIRTSYFEVRDGTPLGGEGPFEFTWDFGTDVVGEKIRTGRGEHKVIYSKVGTKFIILTIKDLTTLQEIVVSQNLNVGKCFEPCGKSENITFDPTKIFIGDINAVPINIDDPEACDDSVDKYVYLPVGKSANAHNPYIELIYTVSNSINGTTVTSNTVGCRAGNDIDEEVGNNGTGQNMIGDFVRLTIEPIEYKCGDNFVVDNFYITWTNKSSSACGQNNNQFCYSTNEPVTLPTPLKAEIVVTDILCKGNKTGIIEVQASGGFAPYSYNRISATSEYQGSNKFVGIAAGDYTIYIKDARGNVISKTATINEPDYALEISNISTIQPTCFGAKGSASVSVKGGTPFVDETGKSFYKYLWNDPLGQTSSEARELKDGVYVITITDANDCMLTATIEIEEPEDFTTPAVGLNQSFECGINSTFLSANTPDPANGEKGIWKVVSEHPTIEYEFVDITDANTKFSAPAGVYELVWVISRENPAGLCEKTSEDSVVIEFSGDCVALDFDGVDDYVHIGDFYNFTSSFTLEAWVKPETLSSNKTVISKKDNSNPTAGGYEFLINEGSPTFNWTFLDNNGIKKSASVSTAYKISTNRWTHLAVTFDGSRARLYVDGVDLQASATGKLPVSITAPFLIGATSVSQIPTTPNNFFQGFIEEVRIWKQKLELDQIRFLMNQRLENDGTNVKGAVLQEKVAVPGGISWASLAGYYPLIAHETLIADGKTPNLGSQAHSPGDLRNMQEMQENTAPLPYVLNTEGQNWYSTSTWALADSHQIKFQNIDVIQPIQLKNVWNSPNSLGINSQTKIDWNIVKLNGKKINNPGTSNNSNSITLLALIDGGGQLNMMGEPNNTGNGLTITHFLKLDGLVDLNGESQLIQPEGSIAEGVGKIHRDQQGTASSFNYNYWSSPVLTSSTAEKYFIKDVLFDGSFPNDPKYPLDITFGLNPFFADNGRAPQGTAIRLSETWLNAFYPEGDKENANQYSAWRNIRSKSTSILPGEGFTMKGSWYISVKDAEEKGYYQNYTFKGFPNNGDIIMRQTFPNQNYLIGNPYPSAISVEEFIAENEGAMNGAVYFWDHFSGMSHYLQEYIGGYAVRNILDGVPAISTDERINANLERGIKSPGAYIPVGQGFFINTTIDAINGSGEPGAPGNIVFRNEFREYVSEAVPGNSQFHSVEKKEKKQKTLSSQRPLFRLNFSSPKGYWRQISVAVDPKATIGVDYGFDAQALDSPTEDMFWIINDRKFVIQGVPDFSLKQVLPLGIKISKEGKFRIKVASTENLPSNTEIFIHDRIYDLYYNILEKEFSAIIEPGEYKDRFEIVFEEPKLIDESKVVLPGELKIFYVNGTQNIKILNPRLSKITAVYLNNMLGQQVNSYHHIPREHETELPVKNLSSGVYIVKAHTDEGIITEKIIIE